MKVDTDVVDETCSDKSSEFLERLTKPPHWSRSRDPCTVGPSPSSTFSRKTPSHTICTVSLGATFRPSKSRTLI